MFFLCRTKMPLMSIRWTDNSALRLTISSEFVPDAKILGKCHPYLPFHQYLHERCHRPLYTLDFALYHPIQLEDLFQVFQAMFFDRVDFLLFLDQKVFRVRGAAGKTGSGCNVVWGAFLDCEAVDCNQDKLKSNFVYYNGLGGNARGLCGSTNWMIAYLRTWLDQPNTFKLWEDKRI